MDILETVKTLLQAFFYATCLCLDQKMKFFFDYELSLLSLWSVIYILLFWINFHSFAFKYSGNFDKEFLQALITYSRLFQPKMLAQAACVRHA